jgi:hypothetical protein
MNELGNRPTYPTAPAPVLTGEPIVTPATMPPIVRDARILAVLGMLGSGIGAIGNLLDPDKGGVVATVAVLALYGAFLAIYIWLFGALKQGNPAAWRAQRALAFLGLIGFPLGTIIYIYLLSKWSKPETKAWFGLA